MPEIISKYYEFLLWLMQRTSKFPRNQRYVFGKEIEEKSLLILGKLIKAYYQKSKLEILKEINVELEIIRYFLRLAQDIDLLTIKQYEFSMKLLQEIGKQVGGWLRQVSST